MTQSPNLFRCQYDGVLLREKDIASGEHVGHRLNWATQGTILDWLKIQYWKLTNQL